MLNFLRKGSHPLGRSLSDVTKPPNERPYFGREITSPGKKCYTQRVSGGSGL